MRRGGTTSRNCEVEKSNSALTFFFFWYRGGGRDLTDHRDSHNTERCYTTTQPRRLPLIPLFLSPIRSLNEEANGGKLKFERRSGLSWQLLSPPPRG